MLIQIITNNLRRGGINQIPIINEYSEHDKFMGVRMPQIRQVAKQCFKSLTFNEINELINKSKTFYLTR
jgi:hypothetical protein